MNRLRSLIQCMSLLDSLEQNRNRASRSYMTDNFMDDFDVREYQALSFDWSVTNSAGLPAYCLADPDRMAQRLDSICQSFSTETTQILTIASRQDEGVLVVPEGGLLSCGLDPLAGKAVQLVLELSVDGGATTIIATAPGSPTNGVVVNKYDGQYVSNVQQEINYVKCLKVAGKTDTYQLVMEEGSVPPIPGSLYKFVYPEIQREISFELVSYDAQGKVSQSYFRHAIPFQVMSATHNTVTVKRWDEAAINEKKGYYNEKTYPDNVQYDADLIIDLPDCANPWYLCTPDGENRLICDVNGELLSGDSSDLENFTEAHFLDPKSWNDAVKNQPNPEKGTYIYGQQYASYKLQLLDYNSVSKMPHVGEKIPCKNWTLRAYLAGNPQVIRGLRFTRENPDQLACAFFMKAHWGFIPNKT